ncbi:MAG: sigma-54-dependent transcriptional regulator [Candidatus Binatia bacterium]
MARELRTKQALLTPKRIFSELEDAGLNKRQFNTATTQMVPQILIVDDDEALCHFLRQTYVQSGYAADIVSSAEEALQRIADGTVDIVVTDISLPGLSGIGLIEEMQKSFPDIPVIVLTAYADVDSAVEILKLGAADYLVKPVSTSAIRESTRTVIEKNRLLIEIRHLRRTFKDRYDFGGILSKAPQMHQVFEVIRMVAGTDVTVLIEGETGTGKELVASSIHHQSERRQGPLVTINCAGVPDTLLESELFGYERGAFTGADQPRPGKIEVAHGGTLFLDEIESMSLAMQAKLLLVLQDHMVQRLGGTRRTRVDMRVIAATNVPLEDLVTQGLMRRDFYYRINVVSLRLLPLRQRCEDIPLLVQDFLNHHPLAVRKKIRSLSTTALSRLLHYPWPGNVRELQNVLERAIVLTTGHTIERIDLPRAKAGFRPDGTTISTMLPLREWLSEQECHYLTHQLALSGGKIAVTAANCGVDAKTLYRKMRLYGLDRHEFHHGDEEKTDTVNGTGTVSPTTFDSLARRPAVRKLSDDTL